MANSDFLRKNKNQHSVKNSISKKMDKEIDIAMSEVITQLEKLFPKLTFEHNKTKFLNGIIAELKKQTPEYQDHFSTVLDSSFLKPDGGFLYASDGKQEQLILISEVKHQGTNDKRANEGLSKQAKGNAIERLGKNLTGIKTIFKTSDIIPFVCFGSGCDFEEDSSIRDRVVTMNEFFPLNVMFVKKEHLPFEPVSMYFRVEDWSIEEMVNIMVGIAKISINHFFG